MDLKTLRSKRGSNFENITSALKTMNNPKAGFADERFWKLEPDQQGNGSAVIRFLPAAEGDELPWVRIYSHGFKGPSGRWYVENSLTTIGKEDPVAEANSVAWATGTEEGKELARSRRRRLSYYANIYIVSDPRHPENEGQVKIYRFGKKIFDKIMDKASPTYEDETPVNVFDLWEGADFKLRQKKVAGYANYDDSTFQTPSALLNGDEKELLTVVNNEHKLAEFLEPSKFKSYDELKAKFDQVMSDSGHQETAADMADAKEAAHSEPATPPKPRKSKAEPPMTQESLDDDDAAERFFAGIMNQ